MKKQRFLFVLLIVFQLITLAVLYRSISGFPSPVWIFFFCLSLAAVIAADLAVSYTFQKIAAKESELLKEKWIRDALDAQQERSIMLESERQAAGEVQKELLNTLYETRKLLMEGNTEGVQTAISGAANLIRSPRRYSDNPFADSCLSIKASECNEHGIRLSISQEIPADISLNGTEICALIGNLLDNSIKAVSSLSDERRIIDLRMHVTGGYMVVVISNPFEEKKELTGPKGRLLVEHGLGLSIVQKIAEAHDGKTEIKQENGVYTTTVWIAVSCP